MAHLSIRNGWRVRLFAFMEKIVRYYILKMADGYHVRQETKCAQPVSYRDLVTCDSEEAAAAIIERITGRKHEQSPESD